MSGYRAKSFAAGGGRAARRALFLLLAPLFQAPLLDAAVIYVSTNTGSDANSGLLSSAPKSTLNSAFSAASNGDTIKIASGVYTESLDAMNKSLAFEGGYAADFLSRDYAVHRSTVMGRFWVNTGGLNVGFDGIAVSSGLTPFYLYWSGNSYSTVTITNSVIFNSSAPAIDTYGSQYFSLTVASSTIYNCRTGIALGPATHRTAAIRNNTISEIREFGGDIGDGKTGIGIDAQGYGTLDISSNAISRAAIYGIDGGYPNGMTLVAGNIVTDCGSGGSGGYSNGGIRFSAGSVQIRNNLIARCSFTAIILDYSNYGSVIRNNTIVGSNTDFAVEEGNGAVFRNNIILNAWVGFSGTDIDVTEISHNLFGDLNIDRVQHGLYDFFEPGLSFLTPTLHDNLLIPAASTAAVFANAAAGDYRLAANSIAADAGDPADDPGDEPGGGRIDCGAYGGTALSPVPEAIPPSAVADLAAAPGSNVGEVDLAWSAPGDDGAADRNIYGASYELRYATFSLTGYTTAQWWAGADLYAPQTAWIVAEDTSVTKSLDVGNLSTQPMGVPGFPERRVLAGLEPGVTYFFMLKTADNSGNVSAPDLNSSAAGTMAQAPAQGSGNHAPVLGHASDNALGPVSHTVDGSNAVGVKFRVKDGDGAADTSTIAVRSDQYYSYGPQFRVDGGAWDDIKVFDIDFSAEPFVPAADFSGTEYTLTWATTMTVTGAESAAAQVRFKVTDGEAESLWAETAPFMLDNKRPVNPGGIPSYRKPVSLKFNWGQSADINFTDYRVAYATYSFSQCSAYQANREWTSADDAALAVRQTTSTVVAGLLPGVTYWYYVEARDSYGHRSSGSNCIGFSTVTLADAGAPGPVTDLAAYTAPGNSGGLRLEWTVPGGDGASGNMTDALYVVKYSSLGIITADSFNSPPEPYYSLEIPTNTVHGQKNTVNFSGLVPGASYWFAIKVMDSADLWSVWNSSQDAPADNQLAFAAAKDYGTDPALAVFSGDFSLPGGAVYDGTGPDEAYALALDTFSAGGPYIYAVGVSSTGGPIAPYDYMIVKSDASGNKLLSRYYHNSWGDTAYAAAVDQAGNLLVTGQTTTGNGDWLTLKLDPNLDLLASAKFNGEAGRNDPPRGLAVDAAGNVFVTGGVGNGSGQPSYHTIKYSSDLAVVLASATWDKGGSEEAQAVAVDPSGNIIVTGGDGADYFTIKYDNALAVISSAAFNGSGNSGDTAYGVGAGADGNIYVTGAEWGVSGWTNYLTVKYSPDLSVVLASASFNGPANNSDYAYALAVDTAGYVLVAGKSWNASGNDDFVTLKYSPSLNLLHSDSYNGGGSDIARAVAAGPGGYTYIAGTSGSYPATDLRVIRRVMSDITPPAGVADLTAQTGTGATGEVKLSWTAPGDDGAAGDISGGRYELKYTSAAIITSDNYASPPEPSYTLAFDTGTVAGQSVNLTVTGLLPGASYWFALKTRDEAGYWSVWASSQDSPGDNNGAYAAAKRPGNDPPLGVFSGDFSQAGGAVYNGTGPDQAFGVAVDTFSPGGPYVYVVGSSSMSGSAIPQDWLVVKYGPQGEKLVSQRLGGPNGWNDYARAAAVDPWGNLIVAGYIMTPSQDNFLVVKYDQNLDIISSATYNGAANSWDEAYGVAADRDGNILVTGQSRNSSNYDFFTIKYSSSMVVLGSATYNGGGNETAYAVAVSASGHVIVAGTNGSDFFTIKYSADLSSVLSSATFAGPGGSYDAANAAAVDRDGNILIAGEEWAGAGSENYRVVKYNPELTAVLVSTSFNGAANGNDYAYGVAVDSSSNILVTGKSQNAGGNSDICTVKFDPNLSILIASAVYNGGGEDAGRAVAAGNSGYVYIAGYSANGSNDDFRALRSQFPDLPPPPALSGAAAGISSITWSWNDVNLGETGYLLIASTGGPVSGALAANTVTWPETGLSTNTAYTRSVAALNMPGTSTSAAVTRWTLAAPPASAAAAVLSSTAINVSWAANDNPAGTDFEVSWSSADAFLTGSAISTAPLTETYSAALGGLLPYTTYYVRVRAYNGDGVPTSFSVAPSTRTNVPPPLAPALSAAALGVSSVSWTWNDVEHESGYRLYSGSAAIFSHGLPAGATVQVDEGLSANLCLTRYVEAFNLAGSSASVPLEACTMAAAPVAPFTMVFSSAAIAVGWDDGGNAGPVPYEVSYSSADAFLTGHAISTASAGLAFGLTLTGLQADTEYFIRVRPLNLQGVYGAFLVVPSTRTNVAPPQAPALSAPALGVSSLAWNWSDVQDEAGYRVYASTGGPVSPALAAGTLTWAETGLSTNTAYARYVAAYNISGSSAAVALTARTLAAPPSGAGAAVLSSAAISVAWGPNGNPAGTDFEVSYSSADAFLTGGLISTAPLTQAYSLDLGGLQAYTTYYVRVRAYNGEGAPTEFSVAPSTRTNPPVPAASVLSGAALGVSSISWAWSDVQYEDGYRLRASTGGAVTPPLGPGAAAWTETGLSTNTEYSRSLETFNISGSSQTPALARWTLAAPPAGLTFQEVFFTSVTLAWSGNGNPSWTDYSVSLWAAGGSTATVTVNGSTTSFSGLTPGVTYYAAVLAFNGAGLPSEGPLASSVTARHQAGAGLVTPGGGGTVTFNAEAGEVRLEVPPGAFAAPVNITIQPPASLPAGRAAERGLAPVGVGAEIIPDTAAQPAGAATLVFNYRDADVSGLDENLLVLARYDEPTAAWLRLPSSPNPAANRVTALVDHFSLYQVMVYTPAQTSSAARTYPNPCRAAAGCNAVTISRLRPGAKAMIYTLSGELVRALTADSLGFAVWDKRNSQGAGAAGGVYFVVVKDGGRILKIALIK